MFKSILFLLALIVSIAGYSQEDSIKKNIISQEVNKTTWKKVSTALNGVDPKYYKIEYVKNNDFVGKGSADLGRIKAVSVVGSSDLAFTTGSMIQVLAAAKGTNNNVEYIRLIWTTSAITEIAAKVNEVNAILKVPEN